MNRTITIDGNELALAANAATPFRYKQLFKKDLFHILGNEQLAQENGVETVTELAFIMAKQAEKADMNSLSQENFVEWLEGFGPMAFVEGAEEILNTYMASTVATSTPLQEE